MDAIRLLLVDNNAGFLRVLGRYLETQSDLKIVASTQSGENALTLARSEALDVVVIDMALDDIPGPHAILRMRAALPKAWIVALTLWDADVYRLAALGAGADQFVSKVAMAAELLPAIRQAARRRVDIATNSASAQSPGPRPPPGASASGNGPIGHDTTTAE